MTDWGGAQWLVLFLMFVRAVAGIGVASGRLKFEAKPTDSKVGTYLGRRVSDVVLLGILLWGGFFQ
jgi:hypothetical protein